MKSNCEFEKKQDYLYVTVTGKYNRNDFIKHLQHILDESLMQTVSRVLVNALNVTDTNLPVLDRFILGEETAKVTAGKLKIAIVWPEKDITRFAETVAVNRGGFIAVFSNIPDAETWLGNKNA